MWYSDKPKQYFHPHPFRLVSPCHFGNNYVYVFGSMKDNLAVSDNANFDIVIVSVKASTQSYDVTEFPVDLVQV